MHLVRIPLSGTAGGALIKSSTVELTHVCFYYLLSLYLLGDGP